jgi:hypothetical protein
MGEWERSCRSIRRWESSRNGCRCRRLAATTTNAHAVRVRVFVMELRIAAGRGLSEERRQYRHRPVLSGNSRAAWINGALK